MLKFDTYDDAVYAHTDYVKFMREHGENLAQTWLADRLRKYGEQAMIPSAHGFMHAINDALDTDICWMTPEMMDLVQVAMETFDFNEPVTADDIFIPQGFMVLPHAFLSRAVDGKTLAWRMLGWRSVDHLVTWTDDEVNPGYTYDLSAEGTPEGGVRFMQVSWVFDEDEWSEQNPEEIEQMRSLGVNWGIAHATSIPFYYMSDTKQTRGEGDYYSDWLLFWRVAQKLMSERIVTKEYRQPGRPARRDAQRFKMPPPILRVIELRRPREDRDGEGRENGSREYTHRWIVRGHWHTYHTKKGPTQKYVGAYEKGPADLPLIVKQRVWNWDR